jgi:MFS family permease
VIARSALFFALNGEWSLGSMLVAETWPARLRGRVISMTRSAWCLGASLAGGITGLVAANFGWRVAVMVPGVIALLAIYVRATCPESPYWVRAQDRKRRISQTLARGGTISDDDSVWFTKAKSVGIRQVFLPDVLPATLVALFVACASTCIYGTVGAWMPLYLSTEKHWSTTEYSLFYVFYGICGFLGLCVVGWLIDRIGRRRTFILTLIEGAIFMTLLFRESHLAVDVRACLVPWLPRLLGPEHDADRRGVSDPNSRRGQWRGLGDRLLRRLRAVPLRHHRTPAAHRIVCAVVPVHPGADDRDGDRRDLDGTGTCRQGARRDHRVMAVVGRVSRMRNPPHFSTSANPCSPASG